MATYLEGCQRNGCKDDISSGIADTVAERGNVCFESGEDGGEPGEEEAEEGDEEELDQGEGCGFGEGIEDRF